MLPLPQLIPTTVVGSYPQPDWLIDRERLSKMVPRVREKSLWRIARQHLQAAQDDATIIAIRDMERAGIDIIGDGEIRRESYSNHFATALTGIDCKRPAQITDRYGKTTLVPRIVGPIRRTLSVQGRDMQFLRANTNLPVKITLPGPFTMSQQAVDEHYGDGEAVAMALAKVVNDEALELQAAGADVIQIDEPWLRNNPEAAESYAIKAINRALDGIDVTTAVHLCFGYAAVIHHKKPEGYSYLPQLADCIAHQISIEAAQPNIDLSVLESLSGKSIMLGVIDLGDRQIETAETVADRIRAGLRYVAPERLIAAPDCGMKYLARDIAFGKLQSLARGAALVRRELAH